MTIEATETSTDTSTTSVIPAEHEADHRPEVYEENGRIIIRASAMGGCIRNLVAARMGIRSVPFNDTALMRMEEGNIHEPHILRALEKEGWVFETTQEELEVEIADGQIIVRGHDDGRAIHTEHGRRAVEAKAMGRNVWDKWVRKGWEEFRRYKWQVAAYQHATGLPAVFAAKNRDTGQIDISLWDEPLIPLVEFKARAIKIARLTEMPECDPVQFPCQRFFIHTGTAYEIDPFTGLEVKRGTGERPAPNEVPDEYVPAFEELARSYKEARRECDEAESKRKEVAASLLAFLKQLNITKGVTGRCTATEVTRTDRRLDQKRLRADHPELCDQYTTETTTRYPKVTWKTENEEE